MVFIGDVVAKEEEYLAGRGTFVDEEGNICASVIGNLVKDDKNKEISVTGKMSFPVPGDTVIGTISDVKEKVVMVDLESIKDATGKTKKIFKKQGIIFIANLSNSFLENPRQAVKIGDLVTTKLIDEDATAYLLSMKDFEDGVLLGLCSKCRSRMIQKGKDFKLKDCHVMVCSNCKSIETRKTAKEYLYRGVNNEN